MVLFQDFEGDAYNTYNEMLSKMRIRAMTEMGLNDNTTIVRQLRPQDLNITNPEWYLTGFSTSLATLTSGTITKGRIVGICAIFNGESVGECTQLKFNVKSADVAIWDTDCVASFKHKVGFADEAIIIGENEVFTISGAARSAGTTNLVGFLGACIERRGLTVSP